MFVRLHWGALRVGLLGLVVGGVLGVAGMAAFTRSPAAPAPSIASPTPPSADAARSTADKWVAALTLKDTTEMSSLYAPDATWRDAAMGDLFHGPAGVKQGWDPVFALPGSAIKDVRLVTSGDTGAVVSWTLTGDQGPFKPVPYSTDGVSVLEMHDGLITRETVYYDTASLR